MKDEELIVHIKNVVVAWQRSRDYTVKRDTQALDEIAKLMRERKL